MSGESPKSARAKKSLQREAVPAYRAIFESLTTRSQNGDVNVSETGVMEEFDVSRDTARKALDLLEREGFARRVRGRGTVILQSRIKKTLRIQVLANENFFRPNAPVALRHKFYGIMSGVLDSPGADERSVAISLVRSEDTISQQARKIIADGGGALLFSSSGMEDLIAALECEQFPHFVHAPTGAGYNSVSTDSYASVKKAAAFIFRNRKRALFLIEDQRGSWSLPMVAAIRDAAKEQSRVFGDEDVVDCGRDGLIPLQARRALASKSYDAVFVATYELAKAVVEECAANGLVFPRDVAFVSCEDHPELANRSPAVSAIRVPYADIGRAMVGELVSQIRFGYRGGVRVSLPEEFILRDTT